MGRREIHAGFGGKARRGETTRKPKLRSENNVKMDRRELGWGSMDWIYLAQDRNQLCAHLIMVTTLRSP
jgi:hypothetical protein